MARKTLDWTTDTTRDILDDAVDFELGAKDTVTRIRILDPQKEWPISNRHWIDAGDQKGNYECLETADCPACKVGGGFGDPIQGAMERTILNVIQYTETPRGVFTEHKTWELPMRSARRNLKKLHMEFEDITKVDLLITSTNPARKAWTATTGNGDWIKDKDLTEEIGDYTLWTQDERYGKMAREVNHDQMVELVKLAQKEEKPV